MEIPSPRKALREIMYNQLGLPLPSLDPEDRQVEYERLRSKLLTLDPDEFDYLTAQVYEACRQDLLGILEMSGRSGGEIVEDEEDEICKRHNQAMDQIEEANRKRNKEAEKQRGGKAK